MYSSHLDGPTPACATFKMLRYFTPARRPGYDRSVQRDMVMGREKTKCKSDLKPEERTKVGHQVSILGL